MAIGGDCEGGCTAVGGNVVADASSAAGEHPLINGESATAPPKSTACRQKSRRFIAHSRLPLANNTESVNTPTIWHKCQYHRLPNDNDQVVATCQVSRTPCRRSSA